MHGRMHATLCEQNSSFEEAWRALLGEGGARLAINLTCPTVPNVHQSQSRSIEIIKSIPGIPGSADGVSRDENTPKVRTCVYCQDRYKHQAKAEFHAVCFC